MKAAIHEIRNHLAVAMAGVEAFLDRKWEPTEAHLSGVLQALREVDALIDDLPRDRTIEFETRLAPIDVCRLIRNELAAMEGFALERGIRLEVRACSATHAACAGFYGDSMRIAEIVTNLLTNAVRYTPAGGAVTVTCGRDAGTLTLSVTDEGPGIRPDERERIFERGFRGQAAASGNGSGSGIGLALVKQFVERQGGSIEVLDAAPGATFVVKLPGERHDAPCRACAPSGIPEAVAAPA